MFFTALPQRNTLWTSHGSARHREHRPWWPKSELFTLRAWCFFLSVFLVILDESWTLHHIYWLILLVKELLVPQFKYFNIPSWVYGAASGIIESFHTSVPINLNFVLVWSGKSDSTILTNHRLYYNSVLIWLSM